MALGLPQEATLATHVQGVLAFFLHFVWQAKKYSRRNLVHPCEVHLQTIFIKLCFASKKYPRYSLSISVLTNKKKKHDAIMFLLFCYYARIMLREYSLVVAWPGSCSGCTARLCPWNNKHAIIMLLFKFTPFEC